jgi:hypothetical protein
MKTLETVKAFLALSVPLVVMGVIFNVTILNAYKTSKLMKQERRPAVIESTVKTAKVVKYAALFPY